MQVTNSNFFADSIAFAIGSALPLYVGIFGTDLIANVTKKTLASEQVLNGVQKALGKYSNVFETVYIGNSDMNFGAYVPDRKTLVLSPNHEKAVADGQRKETLQHECAHSIRHSAEKIRFLALTIPFITYKIMHVIINKYGKKYLSNTIYSKYFSKLPSWIKRIVTGLILCWINQHIVASYARYEEYMTDRTADTVFGGIHHCCYSYISFINTKQFFLELAKMFFLPGLFWHHPMHATSVYHI